MKKDFLLEIGTAELPPRQIDDLVNQLAQNLEKAFKENSLTFDDLKVFSSPRRLAVLFTNLLEKQPNQPLEIKGPSIEIAFDKAQQPTKAAEKFASSCGVAVSDLGRIEDKKGIYLFHRAIKKGVATVELLPEIIIESIKKIQPKRGMRWGENIGPFIRPVYWLTALYDKTVLPVEIFGIKAGNKTFGHRFHHPKQLTVTKPKNYEKILAEKGYVIADKNKRQQKIKELIAKTAVDSLVPTPDDLLDEVTDIVEWPVVLVGNFAEQFLHIPEEVLITTMKVHQRCFPIFDNSGKLLSKFIIVSNIESKEPKHVVTGNEKVIEARLSDAKYFYQLDIKHNFADNLEKLKDMAFQEKLGSIYDKSLRLEKLAPFLAGKIGADEKLTKRAAILSKCDLVTSMVWEFPELQGVMGYHYAAAKEPKEIAAAIKEQYLPRFSKDETPKTDIGAALALADRFDSLIGFFSTTKTPSSNKDPLGLRRLATGIVRIILEKNLVLDLKEIIKKSIAVYGDLINPKTVDSEKILSFIFDRLRHLYIEQGKNPAVFRAVLAAGTADILDFDQRFEAVDSFSSHVETQDLVEIYKRIKNILEKNPASLQESGSGKSGGLTPESEAEKNLVDAVTTTKKNIYVLLQNKEYLMVLKELAKLKPVLADFFEKVTVMCDDKTVRNNRLALLKKLYDLFMVVADLSCLVSG